MSVDVSSIVSALDSYALERLDCMAETFVATAQSNAPHRTGELASSIQSSGASGGGGHVSATVTVGADYGIYVDRGRGAERGLLAFQGDEGIVIVEEVAPMAGSHFWSDTVASWDAIVSGCAG